MDNRAVHTHDEAVSVAAKREEILRLIGRLSAVGVAPVRVVQEVPRLRAVEPVRAEKTEPVRAVELARALPSAPLDQLRAEVLELCSRMDRRIAALESSMRAESAPRVEPALLRSTLSGKILPGLVPDVLQLISSNVLSGVFSISQEGSTIYVHYRDGEIVHAEGEGLEGESAFFAAMAMDRGEFSFQESNQEATRQTIEGKAQFLILEALRQIDEQRGGEGGSE